MFGVLFNAQKMLNNKLGITIDTVMTNKHSDIGSFTRKMTEDEYLVIQEEIDRIYNEFKGHVSAGRGLEMDFVDSIGQGRVWSGSSAYELGLVDVDGGLKNAIEIAAELAGVKKYSILELPKQEDPFKKILKEAMTGQASIIEEKLGVTYQMIQKVESLTKMNGILAKQAFDIVIKGL